MKKLSIFVAASSLLTASACTEILNIDVHYDDGGGGAGPSSGGNAGSDGEGGSGAGVSDGGSGGEPPTGGSSPYCTVADEFGVNGPPDEGCWDYFNENLVTAQVTSGELHIRPNGFGPTTGWYDTQMGYLLYRSVPLGPFAVVAKVRATSKTGDDLPDASGSYHVGGLVIRDPVTSDWLKLEVGYREAGFANPYGVLAAITPNGDTQHVLPYNQDNDIEVELGVCRNFANGMLMFVRNNPEDSFVRQSSKESDQFQLVSGLQVGMSATAFNGPGSDIDARFDYIRIAQDVTIDSVEDCQQILTELANQPPSGECGCN